MFTLLETVYNDFDRIARMRKVFKVETVGDCYVAVAGLPDPRKVCTLTFEADIFCVTHLIHSRMSLTFVFVDTVYCKDHALVMARFARDCLSSLQRITKELEVILGPDTADLTMRIGLHSGPGLLILCGTLG